jgi:hypothetical protein
MCVILILQFLRTASPILGLCSLRNKKPQRQSLGDRGSLFPGCAKERARQLRKTSVKLRDVGSLAVSAASGHKSRVFSILVRADDRHKCRRKKAGDSRLLPTGFRPLTITDQAA